MLPPQIVCFACRRGSEGHDPFGNCVALRRHYYSEDWLHRQARIYEISHRLAVMLGQAAPDAPEFVLKSSSRAGLEYDMVLTPGGIAVHAGEGCEAERYYGDVMRCRHSKEGSKYMTSVTPYTAPVSPVEIQFSPEQLDVIKATIAKGATNEELQLFVATCKRTGLDPFLKQIYAVKRYDAKEKKQVMAIQVGIDGLRLVAERTGKYGGQDPIEWLDSDGVWSEVWTGQDHPVAARTAVYRKDWNGHKAPAVCRWDSYVQTYSDGHATLPFPTWAKMPDVMLGKCAEALALRRAFPAEMSGMAALIDSDYDPSVDAELEPAPTGWRIDEAAQQVPDRAPDPPPAAPSPTCAHDNVSYNEDTTLLTCNTCGVVLEEPPVDDAVQPPLVR